ncbi:MAG: hypothetical protein M5R37_02190 [Melioribacteraceae bacterium]|nr:hypothetical protein [Melioribacteraceae bacterium]
MSIALLRGFELRDWCIRSIEDTTMQYRIKKAQYIVSEYIDRYPITALALKETHPSRSSPHLQALTTCLQEIGKQKKIIVTLYSIDFIKQQLIQHEVQ